MMHVLHKRLNSLCRIRVPWAFLWSKPNAQVNWLHIKDDSCILITWVNVGNLIKGKLISKYLNGAFGSQWYHILFHWLLLVSGIFYLALIGRSGLLLSIVDDSSMAAWGLQVQNFRSFLLLLEDCKWFPHWYIASLIFPLHSIFPLLNNLYDWSCSSNLISWTRTCNWVKKSLQPK